MSKPIPPKPQNQGAADPAPARRSGRVNFDERGQAIWEWAVQTGMFDRNATSQRVRALSEAAMQLEIVDTPPKTPTTVAAPRRGDAVTPYDRPVKPTVPPPAAPTRTPAPRPRDTAGGDPYSRGPAKNPESMTFNPYESTPSRRR